MAKYQIEYNLGGSSRSYKYFETDSDPKIAAVNMANEVLSQEFSTVRIGSFQPLESPRTLVVREYSQETKKPVIRGKRFTLRLHTLKVKYSTGEIAKRRWYEPVE